MIRQYEIKRNELVSELQTLFRPLSVKIEIAEVA